MKPHQLYSNLFTAKNLRQVFEERIKHSSAVGRDGTSTEAFAERIDEEINIALRKIENQTYQFTGYKEKLISKGADRPPRLISIPTVRDRLVLRVLCDLLTSTFSEHLTRPPHEHIKAIKQHMSALSEEATFLRVDIKNYYPSINQSILRSKIRRKIRKAQIDELVMSSLRTPTGKKNSPGGRTGKGVPQGLSISNILSALYLSDVDEIYVGQRSIHYSRYVDDILIICAPNDVKEIHSQLRNNISTIGEVECHELGSASGSKTRIEATSKGIDYLGFHICKNKISVRVSSYKRMLSNIMKLFTQLKYGMSEARFCARLNLKITGCIWRGKRFGWMHFFSQSENTSQLKRLDAYVKRLASNRLSDSRIASLCSFTKTYYEVRFNASNTQYIPNFSTYSRVKKVEFIRTIAKPSEVPDDPATWDDSHVDQMFEGLASREVAYLERDLVEVFS